MVFMLSRQALLPTDPVSSPPSYVFLAGMFLVIRVGRNQLAILPFVYTLDFQSVLVASVLCLVCSQYPNPSSFLQFSFLV